MYKSSFFLIALFFLNQNIFGQQQDTIKLVTPNHNLEATQEYRFSNGSTRIYNKPRWTDMVYKVPKDFLGTAKNFVEKDHAWYLAGALTTTALLISTDQKITDSFRTWSQNQGLSPDNTYGSFGPLQNIPKNIGAGFYLIGNGTTVILLGTGFATYGLLKNDYRAQATASELAESLVLSGVFAQTLKRITGRESPFIAIQNGHPGGEWNFCPSFAAYAKNTPHYDAMPSGHLTTIMAALTVMTTNYPEYKWIKPVGYTVLAGLGFQMIQSEVHWASDYPVALFMGYFIGRTIARNRFKETPKEGALAKKYSVDFLASRDYGYNKVGVLIKF